MTRFQEIYNNPEAKKHFLYDDGVFFAFLDSFPISPGHSLIIPVEPIISIFDLTQEQRNNLYRVISTVKEKLESLDLSKEYSRIKEANLNEISVEFCQKSLESLQQRKNITGYNIGNNDGTSAGRTIDHLHIHLIPRYDGDMIKPEGGIRHMIPGMGYYK